MVHGTPWLRWRRRLSPRRRPRFALAGHSMGGRVCTRSGETRAGAGNRAGADGHGPPAIGCGASPASGRWPAGWPWSRNPAAKACAPWAGSGCKAMVYPSRLSDAVLVNAILDMIASKTPDLYAAADPGVDQPSGKRPSILPKLRCPTLVLCGRERCLVSSETARGNVRADSGGAP